MPRYLYGTRYRPPAPILPVGVGRPGAMPSVLLSALVDTGADLSVLPQRVPAQLALPPVGRVTVVGVDGLPRRFPLYAVEVAIHGYRALMRVIGVGADPLVGRDLLNRVTAHLHGPDGVLDIDLPAIGGPRR